MRPFPNAAPRERHPGRDPGAGASRPHLTRRPGFPPAREWHKSSPRTWSGVQSITHPSHPSPWIPACAGMTPNRHPGL